MQFARWLLAALFFVSLETRAEPGYATRDVELKAEPAGASKPVGTLQKGAKFDILAEKGAWSQVSSGAMTGWALSFYVMKGEPAAQVSMGTKLGEVWSLGTERRAETNATIGIRGLDEEQLKSAQFNAEELKRLEALGETKESAEAFARKAKLAPRPVSDLK